MAFHTVEEVLAAIVPDQREESARQAARRQWAAVAKPLGSLGLLETALEDIAALTLDAAITLDRRTLLLLCADNGVVAQGVTQTDSGVTAVVARRDRKSVV